MLLTLAGRVLLVLAPGAGSPVAVTGGVALAFLVYAFGEGIIQPAFYAGVKEYSDPRTATVGYALVYAMMNLGIVAGEALSPLVRERWASAVEGLSVAEHPAAGISGAFWFFAAITALTLAANLLLFTRRVEERDRLVREAPAPVEGARGLLARLRALPILDPRFLFFIFGSSRCANALRAPVGHDASLRGPRVPGRGRRSLGVALRPEPLLHRRVRAGDRARHAPRARGGHDDCRDGDLRGAPSCWCPRRA